LPIEAGLRALEADLPAGRTRSAVGELADRLERGQALADALDAMHDRFPAHLRAMLVAAVESERLGDVLTGFADHERVARDVRRAFWLGLVYPAVVCAAFVLLALLLAVLLVNQFEEIFLDFGVNLPLLTRWIVGVSHALTEAGWWLLFGPLLAGLGLLIATRVLLNDRARATVLARLPLIGRVIRLATLGEFSHNLGLLVECRVPLERSVVLAGEATGDAEVLGATREMSRRLAAGSSLADASRSAGSTFPEALKRVIAWAEPADSLPPALHLAGDVLLSQAQARGALARVVFTILVFLLVVLGLFVGVVSLFLPLVQLISLLSG
jgi:general secretion pathway protein F